MMIVKRVLYPVLALLLLGSCSDSVTDPQERAVQIALRSSAIYSGTWVCADVDSYLYCEWYEPPPPEDGQTSPEPQICSPDDNWCGGPGYSAPTSVNSWGGADDEMYDCHTAETCTLTPPDSTDRVRLLNEIAKIEHAHEECVEIQNAVLDLLNRAEIPAQPSGHPDGSPGGILLWSPTLAPGGKTLYGDTMWRNMGAMGMLPEVHLWRGAIFAKIIVHEMLHVRGATHHDGQPVNTPGGHPFSYWENKCVPIP